MRVRLARSVMLADGRFERRQLEPFVVAGSMEGESAAVARPALACADLDSDQVVCPACRTALGS